MNKQLSGKTLLRKEDNNEWKKNEIKISTSLWSMDLIETMESTGINIKNKKFCKIIMKAHMLLLVIHTSTSVLSVLTLKFRS